MKRTKKKGESHHCWRCHAAVTMKCLAEGHVKHCEKHDRYYSRLCSCRGCDREDELQTKKDVEETRLKQDSERDARAAERERKKKKGERKPRKKTGA